MKQKGSISHNVCAHAREKYRTKMLSISCQERQLFEQSVIICKVYRRIIQRPNLLGVCCRRRGVLPRPPGVAMRLPFFEGLRFGGAIAASVSFFT